jgi:hypothetical protein
LKLFERRIKKLHFFQKIRGISKLEKETRPKNNLRFEKEESISEKKRDLNWFELN